MLNHHNIASFVVFEDCHFRFRISLRNFLKRYDIAMIASIFSFDFSGENTTKLHD